jgi:hypothetical protein
LVASCSALAEESASWSVLAHCPAAWACPEPPQPAPQLSLLDWSWLASWLVSALLYADESALLVADCTEPALVAYWSASADESASWLVSAY